MIVLWKCVDGILMQDAVNALYLIPKGVPKE